MRRYEAALITTLPRVPADQRCELPQTDLAHTATIQTSMFARLACAAIATFGLASLAAAGSSQLEWVVVPARAKLYMHPEPGAVLAESNYGVDADFTLRKVREMPSGWTEVETACVDVNLCDYDLQDIQIRLFVRSDVLLPVIRKRTTLRLADGSSQVFLPGDRVQAGSAPGLQVVRAKDGSSVAVPQAAIGRVYKATQLLERAATLGSIFDRSSAVGNNLPPKTRLYWSDGSVAGQLVKDHRPDLEIEQRPCFHHRIGKSEALLCGDKTALSNVGAAIQEAFKKGQGEPQ